MTSSPPPAAGQSSSGTRIRVLPDDVANKIAAGEVVERPASVLKELMENAIDAGTPHVDVDIVAGGRKLVAVSDHGCGMSRDDALLSIERHATSKIRTAADIEHIGTLGFRGEALAAIASVSRFRLITGAGAAPGTEVLINGGKLQDVREAGCPPGTSVEVRDLFFNMPGRRKFLRSAETEAGHLRLTFIVQALAHPEIGMAFRVDGRRLYDLPGGARLEDRIRDLFGQDYLKGLRPAAGELDGIRVHGFVGVPAASRADRAEQYVFVNGRPATAPVVAAAIREGYHTILPANRHPILFLFLQMDPERVDVNVHPTKREVRFREPGAVRDALIEAIRAALASDGATLPVSALNPSGPVGVRPDELQAGKQGNLLRIEDLPPTRAFQYPRLPFTPPAAGGARTVTPAPAPAAGSQPAGGPAAPQPAAAEEPAGPGSPWAWCRVLGQVGSLYVVLETEDGVVLMDPHAAHERVLFERFMKAVARGQVESQGLLVPETVELMPRDAINCRRNLEHFRRMGFGISEFGGDTFVVDAMPVLLAGTLPRLLLAEVATHLDQAGARGGGARWQDEAIAQAACKAAVKSRDRLTLAEIERLVVALASAEMPYTCPHGRPTLIFMSFAELNRKFGRE